MDAIKEQDGWYYLEKDGSQLTTSGGRVVRTMFKDLAERLVEDLEKYGEDPTDPVSLVAFHYSVVEFFEDGLREFLEEKINQMVYNVFGLTKSEISIVEREAVT